jgi:hypothetical protein
MSNIYYCYEGNRQSILRAVLSPHNGKRLLRDHAARYVGQLSMANYSPETPMF